MNESIVFKKTFGAHSSGTSCFQSSMPEPRDSINDLLNGKFESQSLRKTEVAGQDSSIPTHPRVINVDENESEESYNKDSPSQKRKE